MTIRRLAGALALCTIALAAHAADIPVPKVMSDSPPDKGAWRMEMIDVPGMSAEQLKMMGGGMTVCTTAGQAMARDDPAAGKSDCTGKLLEDTSARAVMEMQCPGKPPTITRTTITRAGAKSYDMVVDQTEAGKVKTMKMRMSYAGACSEKDSVISLQKDSPACQKIRAQLAAMNPDKQCTGSGREQCLQAMARSRASMEQTCK